MKREAQKVHYKTGEAARYLSVSRRTLSEWTSQGRIPCYRLGTRTTVYSIEALNTFLDAHKIGGKDAA